MTHRNFYQLDENDNVVATVRTNGEPIDNANSMELEEEGIKLGMKYTAIDKTFRFLDNDGLPIEEGKVIINDS